MNYLQDIYRLAYIKRYSNVPKLHEESVAEHSFFVGAICMKLREQYQFDIGIALMIATAHDMPEMELNDCPWIIKHKYPRIMKAFEDCEKEVIERMPEAVKTGVMLFNLATSVEAKICKLADAMQCIQFSEVELKLGNKGYMQVVYDNSVRRVEELKKELKEYEL